MILTVQGFPGYVWVPLKKTNHKKRRDNLRFFIPRYPMHVNGMTEYRREEVKKTYRQILFKEEQHGNNK